MMKINRQNPYGKRHLSDHHDKSFPRVTEERYLQNNLLFKPMKEEGQLQ